MEHSRETKLKVFFFSKEDITILMFKKKNIFITIQVLKVIKIEISNYVLFVLSIILVFQFLSHRHIIFIIFRLGVWWWQWAGW